jgi:putative hydrolase of the HAD superfamily
MTRYKAILFDLFDTLVDLNLRRFPLVSVAGTERRTTGGVVYQALRAYYDHIRFEEFFPAFLATYREVDALRAQNHREILSQERFSRLLQRLGIPTPPPTVVEHLVAVHMDEMFAVMEFPTRRRRVLDQLKPAYRLGLVSNFDHPPTVYRLLEHDRLTPYFQAIIISAEIGWRKPRTEIFAAALSSLGVAAWEALHVGDTPDADIVGAKAAGMQVAWFDRHVTELSPDLPRPDYTIHKLEELLPILTSD